ncbi:MAG: hypothetical protein IPK17_02025 [Chloroflexi bacterium]|uniref:hypothetical protein n=1 Tax=Candidatus Flexifilum breve TaxID=3140694 RepID=UPI0031351E73|nr:hypothetical protein [Chloroflexota bacterium]
MTHQVVRALPIKRAMALALELATAFLPTFEELNPQLTWVRDWINAAQKLERIDYSQHSFAIWADYEGDEASKAYLDGIRSLDAALYVQRAVDTNYHNIGAAIHAFAGAFLEVEMRQYDAAVITAHHAAFDESAPMSEDERYECLMAFRASPTRKRFTERFWNDLADKIAAQDLEENGGANT